MNAIWIVCRGYYSEGLSEPFYWFSTEVEAADFKTAVEALSDRSISVVRAEPGLTVASPSGPKPDPLAEQEAA